jgi:hypothetical protein
VLRCRSALRRCTRWKPCSADVYSRESLDWIALRGAWGQLRTRRTAEIDITHLPVAARGERRERLDLVRALLDHVARRLGQVVPAVS